MADQRITLDVAAFLDSPQGRSFTAQKPGDVRDVVRLWLEAIYDGLGKAPKHLDGDDVHQLLCELLPARFGRKDPRIPTVLPVLRAWIDFLEQREVVVHAFEVRRQLDDDEETFLQRAGTAAAQASGGVAPKARPFVHRGAKVGRNDPCPCGSGKKFKACCARLG